MIIAATADVHAPQYYEDFVRAIDIIQVKPDLFLIAGDMINRGEVQEYEKIYNALFGKITCPIIACFGNNELIPDISQEIKQKFREIRFLKDDSTILKVGNITVGIVGTVGSLDVPTRWQMQNIPNIEGIYRQRIDLVDRHLQRMMTNFKIVLMHYAPSYKTLEGENPNFYGSIGSRVYENVLFNRKPNLVVHGHSHRGKKMAWFDTVPIFNVSFAMSKEIVIINTDELKPGLTKFV
ncbi:MAG: metallophosphoesterase [Candidatus Aenigmatarchaeota archaeon]